MAEPPARVKRPIRKAKRFVERVTAILQRPSSEAKMGITVSEVFVGGSLGQGTRIPQHFDIDLIVFSSSLHPSNGEVSEDRYKSILAKLLECLQQGIKDIYTPRKTVNLYHGWSFCAWHLKVDLQLSPRWVKPDLEDLYNYLWKIHKNRRILFACGTAKHQNDLIKHQPQQVKTLITRFKAWRNRTWHQENNGCPKSYFLSMLVLISYKRAPQYLLYSYPLKRLASWMTEDVKELVKSIYKNPDLDLHVPGENPIIMRKYTEVLPPKPRIIDPYNPFKNFYKQGLGQIQPQQEDSVEKRWAIFMREIQNLDLTVHFC